jgi:hypothetical protein
MDDMHATMYHEIASAFDHGIFIQLQNQSRKSRKALAFFFSRFPSHTLHESMPNLSLLHVAGQHSSMIEPKQEVMGHNWPRQDGCRGIAQPADETGASHH